MYFILLSTILCLSFVSLAASLSLGADIYVSTVGKDTNRGTRSSPVATIAKAKSLASGFVGKELVTVHVADGTYYLPETVVFTPADSGSA